MDLTFSGNIVFGLCFLDCCPQRDRHIGFLSQGGNLVLYNDQQPRRSQVMMWGQMVPSWRTRLWGCCLLKGSDDNYPSKLGVGVLVVGIVDGGQTKACSGAAATTSGKVKELGMQLCKVKRLRRCDEAKDGLRNTRDLFISVYLGSSLECFIVVPSGNIFFETTIILRHWIISRLINTANGTRFDTSDPTFHWVVCYWPMIATTNPSTSRTVETIWQ